ncbi:unnamed protein product [Trifolium pratense]|uniref:Uncharacterized protein n=1 Tax=Trifolium pratense TaxID=57577 RepID=A0ACB0M9P0_TRIPR|nr:unnamed protein product [Trifolium pratense]
MTNGNSCPQRQQGLESIMHVLRDFEDIMKFWSSIIKPDNWAKFFSMDLMSWLEWYLDNGDIENTLGVGWELPPIDTLKFNVDVAQSKRNDFSACGKLLRDSNGGLIQGFYCNLGRNNAQGAEMWSLVHGMRIARHLNRVIFKTDSTFVADVVLNRILPSHLISNLS